MLLSILGLSVTVTATTVHVEQSSSVKKSSQIRLALINLLLKEECPLFMKKANFDDLVYEWEAHNFLYYLHLFRSNTVSVDYDTTDTKQFWYRIIGHVYEWFL